MPDGARESPVQASYHILQEIGCAFLARGESGQLALLVPVTSARPPLERATGDIVLRFPDSARFEVAGRSFEAHAAVIECANHGLEETFKVLADDVAAGLTTSGTAPSPQDVSRTLARWEELLRSKRALSREEEVGLWGELWMMLQLTEPDSAASVWRGPDDELVDFVGGGVGIECKASFRRLQHFVSQEQVTRPLGELRVFLQSIWVDHDTIGGQSINDLIAELSSRLTDRRDFERKILQAGYSRSDAHRYKLKLRVLEPPLLFPIHSVPRVQSADSGVSHIRYLASLAEEMALPQPEALAITMRLCMGGDSHLSQ